MLNEPLQAKTIRDVVVRSVSRRVQNLSGLPPCRTPLPFAFLLNWAKILDADDLAL